MESFLRKDAPIYEALGRVFGKCGWCLLMCRDIREAGEIRN